MTQIMSYTSLKSIFVVILVMCLALSGCSGPINSTDTIDEGQITSSTKSVEYSESETHTIHTSTGSQAPTSTDKIGSSTAIKRTKTESTHRDPTNWAREKKYRYFTSNYTDIVDESQVIDTRIYAENKSINITYRVSNDPVVVKNQTLEIIMTYATLVDIYVDNNDYPAFDSTWVPKQINMASVSPSGETYRTGHLKYEWAYKWKVGSGWNTSKVDDRTVYTLKFYNTTDIGTAHPGYEESISDD